MNNQYHYVVCDGNMIQGVFPDIDDAIKFLIKWNRNRHPHYPNITVYSGEKKIQYISTKDTFAIILGEQNGT